MTMGEITASSKTEKFRFSLSPTKYLSTFVYSLHHNLL